MLFPPPGDLLDPGTEPVSPALVGRFFTVKPSGKFSCPQNLFKKRKRKITDKISQT